MRDGATLTFSGRQALELFVSPPPRKTIERYASCMRLSREVREGRMQTLPQFKVLQRGEQPPDEGYHVLLVHRFSSDWRALVHDITGRVPPSADKVCHLTGRNAFTGTPGEALRAADQIATECGAPVVYVRDDT